ncbi:DUF5999 family protein [Kitasatospora purpeofusca]|uniref:DUF5999 family protein n=1 Tax=Kitasatospora purpeofusca TaxID=67352 RepID=UPI0035E03A5F
MSHLKTTTSPVDHNREHRPTCPDAKAAGFQAGLPVAGHGRQGGSLLCNGVILFSDTSRPMPDGCVVAPQERRADTCERAA